MPLKGLRQNDFRTIKNREMARTRANHAVPIADNLKAFGPTRPGGRLCVEWSGGPNFDRRAAHRRVPLSEEWSARRTLRGNSSHGAGMVSRADPSGLRYFASFDAPEPFVLKIRHGQARA